MKTKKNNNNKLWKKWNSKACNCELQKPPWRLRIKEAVQKKQKKGKRKLQTKWNGKELKIDMVRINTTNNNMFAVIFRILGIEEFERKSLPFWFQKPHSLTCLLITLLPVLFFLCPCFFVINWLLFRFTVYRVNVGISSFRVWHKQNQTPILMPSPKLKSLSQTFPFSHLTLPMWTCHICEWVCLSIGSCTARERVVAFCAFFSYHLLWL